MTRFLVSIEELLETEKQRKKDGFPPRIKIRVISTERGDLVLPYVEDEKLVHDLFDPFLFEQEGDLAKDIGSGEGKVGETIGYIKLKGEGEGEEGEGDGEGKKKNRGGLGSADHQLDINIIETARRLSQKYKLPNLKEKKKKIPTKEYSYELTSVHRKAGQILDKKRTLREIVKTNLILGRVERDNILPWELIVRPEDKIYRILSKERLWKPQAVVFFVRDYSGSMQGVPTTIAVKQHFVIYDWLLQNYQGLVIPRFIVHDTEAREVKAEEYFKSNSYGGTLIASAYRLINKIIESEDLAKYNIYVFQVTDGEDFDDGSQAQPEILKILSLANRFSVCVLRSFSEATSIFEDYVAEFSNYLNFKVVIAEPVDDDDKLEEVIVKLIT